MRVAGLLLFCLIFFQSKAQNILNIPPVLNGTTFSLTIQSGTKTFFTGYNTPTYGINGAWMAPTLVLNKNDSVNINITNNLNTSTTIHWHGMHIAAINDGGPKQVINIGSTWNPKFKIRNSAGTFWYHPHGDGKTDLHVSKGIAGMIIVKDSLESTLTLPRTYGVDDIPIIVQSKAFDVLRQIAIATEDDTTLFVNGTIDPYVDLPAQVIRLRLLNGASMRTFLFGFSNGAPFKMIASDGGLLDNSVTLNQLRLSPGERAEILVDLTGMNGQTIYFKNLGSQLPNGIYGAAVVATGAAAIPGYNLNPRNGADYNILKINITPPTGTPVTTMPSTITTNTPWNISQVNATRRIYFSPQNPGDSTQMAEGPFFMNGKMFDMDSINIKTQLNNIEIWRLVNKTLVAHPFHIHDIQFYVLDINGVSPPSFESGKKDVVLVMPGDSLQFITKFEDFANDTLGYMYHCHLLHHEDDGMMGQFVVMSPSNGIHAVNVSHRTLVYPNPTDGAFTIEASDLEAGEQTMELRDALGRLIFTETFTNSGPAFKKAISLKEQDSGIYSLSLISADQKLIYKLVKQ